MTLAQARALNADIQAAYALHQERIADARDIRDSALASIDREYNAIADPAEREKAYPVLHTRAKAAREAGAQAEAGSSAAFIADKQAIRARYAATMDITRITAGA